MKITLLRRSLHLVRRFGFAALWSASLMAPAWALAQAAPSPATAPSRLEGNTVIHDERPRSAAAALAGAQTRPRDPARPAGTVGATVTATDYVPLRGGGGLLRIDLESAPGQRDRKVMVIAEALQAGEARPIQTLIFDIPPGGARGSVYLVTSADSRQARGGDGQTIELVGNLDKAAGQRRTFEFALGGRYKRDSTARILSGPVDDTRERVVAQQRYAPERDRFERQFIVGPAGGLVDIREMDTRPTEWDRQELINQSRAEGDAITVIVSVKCVE